MVEQYKIKLIKEQHKEIQKEHKEIKAILVDIDKTLYAMEKTLMRLRGLNPEIDAYLQDIARTHNEGADIYGRRN